MRALAIVAGLLTVLASPASAQNERPALWDGVYLGFQAGGGTGQGLVNYPSGRSIRPTITDHPVSVQLGYNVRRGDWVYGPELMVNGTTSSGTSSCANPAFTCTLRTSRMAHLDGRLGHIFGNAMLYGMAGISSGMVQYLGEYTGTNPAYAGYKYDNEQHHIGWNAGIGVEYAFTGAWSAGLEYRHIQLYDAPHKSTNNFNGAVTDRMIQTREETISARLNYNFSGR
jgi:outer membrane immunogenic protein